MPIECKCKFLKTTWNMSHSKPLLASSCPEGWVKRPFTVRYLVDSNEIDAFFETLRPSTCRGVGNELYIFVVEQRVVLENISVRSLIIFIEICSLPSLVVPGEKEKWHFVKVFIYKWFFFFRSEIYPFFYHEYKNKCVVLLKKMKKNNIHTSGTYM